MIAELFRKVKRKAEQRASDTFGQYWESIIRPLAEGRDVDEEAIVQSAEAIGRNPEQVESDVELFRQRQKMADELKSVPAWQRESERLQAVIDKAAAELQGHQQRLQAIIDSTYAQRQEIENRISGCTQHATELANTCPNPSLASREQELTEQRKELLDRRRPLIESLSRGQGSLVGALEHAESQVAEFQDQASRGDDDARQYAARMRESVAGYKVRIRQSESKLAELDEQLSTLDRELAAIRQQKLNP